MKIKLYAFIIIFLSLALVHAQTDSKSVVILIDISLSINESNFKILQNTAVSLVEQLQPNDRIALYAIGNEPQKLAGFTARKEDIIQKIHELKPETDFTALYDTIFSATHELDALHGANKVILVLSDGVDENSTLLFDDVIREFTNRNIPIFSIGIGDKIAGKKILKRLSVLTKGKFVDTAATDPKLVSEITAQGISQALAEIEKSNAQIKVTEKKETAPAIPAASPQSVQPSQLSQPASKESLPTIPAKTEEIKSKTSISAGWIAVIVVAAVAIIVLVGIFTLGKEKKPRRVCPKCGRQLEDFQLQCPNCKPDEEKEQQEPFIDPALFRKTPVPEETIENTFVLLEKPALIVRKGKMIGKKYFLTFDVPTTIGRSQASDIQLDDISVSSQHCRIAAQDKKFIIVDLQSTNGTFLNEKRIKKAELNEGDIVRIGETQLIFKIEQTR